MVVGIRYQVSEIHPDRLNELNIDDDLVRFNLVGDNLEEKTLKVGYDNLARFGFYETTEDAGGRVYYRLRTRLSDEGSFIRTTGENPTRVEFRVIASQDLVEVDLRNAEFIWITK